MVGIGVEIVKRAVNVYIYIYIYISICTSQTMKGVGGTKRIGKLELVGWVSSTD